MCSCSLFFFHWHSFSTWWSQAFLIFSPPVDPAGMKFSCFSSSEIGLLCLLSTSMQTLKFSRKKDSALLLFSFLSQSLGGHAIYRRKARVLETRNFTTAYMNGWTYLCAHGRFFQNQNFFGCIPCARFARAMSPLLQAITT